MNGDAAAKGVPDEPKTVVSGPGKRTGCEDEEHLSDIETRIVREVAYAITKTPTEEVEEHHTTDLLNESVRKMHERDA